MLSIKSADLVVLMARIVAWKRGIKAASVEVREPRVDNTHLHLNVSKYSQRRHRTTILRLELRRFIDSG